MKNSSDGFLNDQKPANFVTCEHWLCCEEYHIFISCLLIIGCQIVGMLVSAVLKYEKIKHCSGGTTFFLLALVNLLTSQTFYPRQLMISCLVCIWALRLAVYLMIRAYSVEASHKISVAFAVDADPRQPPNTVLHRVVFWMVQIIWISVVSLPVILIDCQPFHPMPQGSSKSGPLTDTDIGGLTLWIVGFLCEFFADHLHGNNPRALDVDRDHQSALHHMPSPLSPSTSLGTTQRRSICVVRQTLNLLFIKIITFPSLSQTSSFYFSIEEYQDYKHSTSPIIPMPPELYVGIPDFLKKLLLFELPFYDHIPDDAKPKEPQKTLPRSSRRDMDMPF